MNSEGSSLLASASLQHPVRYGTDNAVYSTEQLHEQPSDHAERLGEVPNYRPVTLRWWFLAGLGIVVLTFGALMELAIHKLPVQNVGLTLFSRGYNDQGRARLVQNKTKSAAESLYAHPGEAHLETLATVSTNPPNLGPESTRLVYHGLKTAIADFMSRAKSPSPSTQTDPTSQVVPTTTITTRRRVPTFKRPDPLAQTTQPPERPLRDFGHSLRPLQPRVPSRSAFGSFGSVGVTSSFIPPPSRTPTPKITDSPSTSLTVFQPLTTVTITIGESPSSSAEASGSTTASTIPETTVIGTTRSDVTLPASTVPGTTIRGSTMTGITQSDTTLKGIIISETSIPGTTVPGTTISETTLPGTTVPKSVVTGTTILGTTILGTTIPGTTIPATTMAGSSIPGTTLTGSTASGTTILGTTIPETTIPATTIQGTTVLGTTIPGTTIQGTIVHGTTIPRTTIHGTTISGKTIRGKTVPGTTIQKTTLRGTTIAGTTIMANTDSATALSPSETALYVLVEATSGVTTTMTLEVAPTPITSTLTDAKGVPTATTTLNTDFGVIVETVSSLTETLAAELSRTTETLTDPSGKPTATLVLDVPVTSELITMSNAQGSPTRTLTLVPLSVVPTTIPNNATDTPPRVSGPSTVTQFYYISQADYFLGTFAAVIIATILSIPIRMVNLNMQRLQPFHELVSQGGATATYSLCRSAGSWSSLFQDLRQLFRGRWPLTLLTASMVFFSAVLTTFSSEVFVLKLHGSCHHGGGNAKNCAYTIGVSALGARIAEALLFFIAGLIALSWILMRKWRSGVESSPWSIAGTTSLLGHSDIRDVMGALPTKGTSLSNSKIEQELAPYCFRLGHFESGGRTQYGIIVNRTGELEVPKKHFSIFGPGSRFEGILRKTGWKRKGGSQPFFMLGIPGRIIVIAFVSGVIGLVGYYNSPRTSVPFEKFLDSESFGVRLLFTALGVIITYGWEGFFTAVAHLSPYRRMARSPQTAQHSIAISPPTNSFAGFYSAIKNRDILLGCVAFAGILSEFLPILLSNVPYQVTQTPDVHLTSTWISVAIMSLMVLIVAGSFFARWPPFPVDVRTIAGAAYYVCDSRLLIQNMVASGVTVTQQLQGRVGFSEDKYTFGDMVGVSGVRRIGVDTEEGLPATEGGSLMRQNDRVLPSYLNTPATGGVTLRQSFEDVQI